MWIPISGNMRMSPFKTSPPKYRRGKQYCSFCGLLWRQHILPYHQALLSLLISYSFVLYGEWPFKPPAVVNCPPIPPHPGNQTQIENIQPPLSVWLSIFSACQDDVTFSIEPVGCEGGDNISGLWMRFELHCPISHTVSNWTMCFL